MCPHTLCSIQLKTSYFILCCLFKCVSLIMLNVFIKYQDFIYIYISISFCGDENRNSWMPEKVVLKNKEVKKINNL